MKSRLSPFWAVADEVEARALVRHGRRCRPPGKRHALKGTKVAPQFRSKKNPKLTWSGRGAMVGWMKEEMKGTKLKKEDFRIAK